ncbi:speckle-type POZ protein-like isoform X2 [Phymastichus coffea]|nr:speckle-type POZ protein-like isoform X2 [Phymastichus coffea]
METFEDIWRIENFKERFSETKTLITSPLFSHDCDGSIINYTARVYQVAAYGGLLIIESHVQGSETISTMKVQCLLRKDDGKEISLSTSKRDITRFKHVTQLPIVLRKANGFIPNNVLTIVFRIQITVNQDYYSVKNTRLSDDLGYLLRSGCFSDVTLIVDCCEIKAHKGILACRSSAFASMFRNESDDVVHINNYSLDVMNELLSFCYTGWIGEVSEELLHASDEFDIVGLKIICEDNLCTNLNVDNAVAFLVCAEHYRALNLKKNAAIFIAKNLKECVKTPQFKEISHSMILEIVQMWSTM